MNSIMVTSQVECAKKYSNKTEAEKDIEAFKRLFFYESPKIEVVELED
ncbi:hypothetical protein OFO01_07200 [Campylobacter sp. JMF_01 NE2]|nr:MULTISPECIES: hypothetical protein [unclassified Campylobacter]MDA3053250.1 hypothetical protein [Campylobacter sp. JMF_03 NE3]MDA3067567.1 hypothetical protein [Campylobacter sp. JMF_01 NE2]